MTRFGAVTRCGGVLLAALLLATLGARAETSKSMQAILKELDLKPDILSGLDQELALSPEILAAAKKEGALRIIGSWDPQDFTQLVAPFSERYPWIKITYNYGRAMNERAIKPLMAFKEGRYIADIVTGFGGGRRLFQQANAFEDLRSLPGFKNPITGNDPNGGWMIIRNRYWCMAYNTNLIKEADLPKTWDDILTNPALHNGKIGVPNRPQVWLLPLWTEKGRPWVENFVDKFFNVTKPQIRKEGLSAMITLTVAGELAIALPADPARVKAYADKKAPIGYYCPDLVPRAVSQIAILRGAPNTNAAKVFSNWMVSKEGQITQFYAEQTSPSHRDLQIDRLIPFAEQLKGRKQVDEEDENLTPLNEIWGKSWKGASKK